MRTQLILLAALHIAAGNLLISPLLPSLKALQKIPVKPAGDYTFCDNAKFNRCQNDFNKELGLQADANFHHVDVLQSGITELLNKPLDEGLLKLCRARSMFYQCLSSSYRNCMNRFNFLQHGLSVENATSFVQIFDELEFMCNGGLLQSVQKWDCIVQNSATADPLLVDCRNSFLNASLHDPDNICSQVETLMLCYRAPFYISCGEDVAWWSCEQVRVAANIDDYCPHLSCSYQTFPNSVAEQNNEVPHIRTRREAIHTANPQFMNQRYWVLKLLSEKEEESDQRQKKQKNSKMKVGNSIIHVAKRSAKSSENDAVKESALSFQTAIWCDLEGTFNIIVRLPDSLNWMNGTELANRVNRLLMTNITELLTICNAYQYFVRDVGTYDACINPWFLLRSTNATLRNVFDYVHMHLKLDFVCNSGFEEVSNQWHCLHTVSADPKYKNCVDDFNKGLETSTDPLCNTVDTFMSCAQSVGISICKNNAVSAYLLHNILSTAKHWKVLKITKASL
ncbi:unnamed protein product [Enterobius vermicularis]|uniref:GDNF family receptor alpha-like n=1 Tax=Enterobius vermicularis TaxID=51028 RepID=A0A158QA02_ENTVE|nr:unnamed protein product [Enterobius vermicularis]